MTNDLDSRSKSESPPRRTFSRRQIIQGLGAVGVAGAGAALIPLTKAAGSGPARAGETEDDQIAAHQWVWVIDLRRCDGCDLCTIACRKMHALPDDQAWIKVHRVENAAGQTIYMPRPCMQCQEPPCLNVCPVGATFKAADGVVLVDQDRCIGCRMCMAACPYDARTFTWNDPPPAPHVMGKPTPEFPVPQQKGTVGKCVLCVHDLRYGRLPTCVEVCIMGALYIGDLKTDLATNGRETVKLSDLLKDNDVFHYKEELNTHPRVYYIPGHGQDMA